MLVDLNHNGSSPFGAGRERPITLSELINPYIDAGLQKRRAEQPKRPYIGASELGDECERKVVMSAMEIAAKPFDGWRLRVFDMGHKFEELVADWLKAAGFYIITIDPRTGQQFEFRTADDRIQGHCDGKIIGGPDFNGATPPYPWLWENKALKAKAWNAIVKHGVQVAEPKYYYQSQIYMGYFDLPFTLFTTVNKDSALIYHEMIAFNLTSAQRVSDRGVTMIRHLDAGTLPKRVSMNRDHFRCRMCDRSESCWGMPE